MYITLEMDLALYSYIVPIHYHHYNGIGTRHIDSTSFYYQMSMISVVLAWTTWLETTSILSN